MMMMMTITKTNIKEKKQKLTRR